MSTPEPKIMTEIAEWVAENELIRPVVQDGSDLLAVEQSTKL